MAIQWLSLIAAIWLQCINGTNTNFPAYSSQLKHLLSLSQLQLNNLALASDAGKLLGWLSGIATAYLPLWLVLMIGATLGFMGYGVQYLFITNQISGLSYWHIFLLTSLAGNGICWINTVSYIIAIQNFPFDRQIAVGLSTSYQGLSAKIFTVLVDVVSRTSPSHRAKTYLLLNAVVPLLVCIATSPIAKHVKIGKSKNLAGGFIAMFVITTLTGIYAILSSFSSITSSLPPVIMVIGMGLFLAVPLAVPLGEKIRESLQQKCWLRREMRVCHVATENNDDNIMRSMESGEAQENGSEVYNVRVREELGVRLMLQRVDFWLYYFAYLLGATLGLVYLNNLGQIVESRGSSRTSSLVSLCSSFTFFGRLIPSVVDYHLTKKNYVVSRPASIALTMIPLSGAFFLLLMGNNLSLYISTAIIGTCTGAITSISVPTTTELFGAKNFGVNHNILVTNIPVGSFVFGDLAAILYKNQETAADGSCMGVKCYETTFIIWGSLCLLGTLLAVILHARTRKFYSQNLV
ncbi:protein NUCLEAR FUSION DEFECTIVE 4 [Coffea eugenioides]|uniref:Protein NUCLEAR FUSION DEFECTIVE 4-like n=1 Tax=Coffea arabica TaxID=13443 RepID=A0A6P6UMU3_COFAR|nr:protein NUCLEAR FUSION DEFECTIVE 4-like [Coffea arabica]XP_027149162.1 protein NUCLEAR FUSION DEFECTIVE 4 [Coffea eugenioides]